MNLYPSAEVTAAKTHRVENMPPQLEDYEMMAISRSRSPAVSLRQETRRAGESRLIWLTRNNA